MSTVTTAPPAKAAPAATPMSLLWIAGVVLLAVVPFVAPSLQLLVDFALAKGLAVVGVTVLLRAGQVSFGNALFFGISAYVGAFVMASAPGTDFFVILIAGTLGAVLAGLAWGSSWCAIAASSSGC